MNRTMPDLLEAFLDKGEGNVFLQYGETKWTPPVLSSRVLAWGQLLHELGVRPGHRVGIYLQKSLEEIGLIFSVSHLGAVFVNIHPSNKFHQVAHIINDCGIEVLLTSAELMRAFGPLLSELKLKHIVVKGDPEGLRPSGALHTFADAADYSSPPSFSRPRLIDDDIATIIYSSGSTGKPKGIIQTHGNLIEGAEITSCYLKVSSRDRLLSVLPFSFDYGLNQLLSAVYTGCPLILANYLFPLDILKILEGDRITGLAGVPTIWLDLLNVLEKYQEIDLPCLRYITNSGGKLYPSTVQRLRKRLPSTDIYLMYGMTEAFRSTYLPPDEADKRPGSIGKAIPNVSVHVINEEGKECKAGEVGELIHRGALISKGYWGDREKTEQVFRPNPLLPEHLRFTETVVYSGDLVWRDEEGFFYIEGRKDSMIKSAGHRVSPDEISEILVRMEGVQNAAVIGVDSEYLGQRIVAFVQVPDSSNITEKDCRAFAQKFLPPHMIPSEIRLVRQLPVNSNGKVNVRELNKQVSDA